MQRKRKARKEKEENIWRRKIVLCAEENKNGEGKGAKCLEKENFFFEKKKYIEGKGGKYFEGEKIFVAEEKKSGGKYLEKENR